MAREVTRKFTKANLLLAAEKARNSCLTSVNVEPYPQQSWFGLAEDMCFGMGSPTERARVLESLAYYEGL